jgi:hypothetical protein
MTREHQAPDLNPPPPAQPRSPQQELLTISSLRHMLLDQELDLLVRVLDSRPEIWVRKLNSCLDRDWLLFLYVPSLLLPSSSLAVSPCPRPSSPLHFFLSCNSSLRSWLICRAHSTRSPLLSMRRLKPILTPVSSPKQHQLSKPVSTRSTTF